MTISNFNNGKTCASGVKMRVRKCTCITLGPHRCEKDDWALNKIVALSQTASDDNDGNIVRKMAAGKPAADCKNAGRTIAGSMAHNRGQIVRPPLIAFWHLDFQ